MALSTPRGIDASRSTEVVYLQSPTRAQNARCATLPVDRLQKGAHDGRMSRPSALEERINRQNGRVTIDHPDRAANEHSRAGVPHRHERGCCTQTPRAPTERGERRQTGRARSMPTVASSPLSIEERLGHLERLLLKLLAQHGVDDAP